MHRSLDQKVLKIFQDKSVSFGLGECSSLKLFHPLICTELFVPDLLVTAISITALDQTVSLGTKNHLEKKVEYEYGCDTSQL